VRITSLLPMTTVALLALPLLALTACTATTKYSAAWT
jgi:hypothetical protein